MQDLESRVDAHDEEIRELRNLHEATAASLESISDSVQKIEGYIQTIVSIRSFLVWVMPVAAFMAWLFGFVQVG